MSDGARRSAQGTPMGAEPRTRRIKIGDDYTDYRSDRQRSGIGADAGGLFWPAAYQRVRGPRDPLIGTTLFGVCACQCHHGTSLPCRRVTKIPSMRCALWLQEVGSDLDRSITERLTKRAMRKFELLPTYGPRDRAPRITGRSCAPPDARSNGRAVPLAGLFAGDRISRRKLKNRMRGSAQYRTA